MVRLGVESSAAARGTTVPPGRCTGWPGTVTAAARPLAAGTRPGPGRPGSGGRRRLPPRSRRRRRPSQRPSARARRAAANQPSRAGGQQPGRAGQRRDRAEASGSGPGQQQRHDHHRGGDPSGQHCPHPRAGACAVAVVLPDLPGAAGDRPGRHHPGQPGGGEHQAEHGPPPQPRAASSQQLALRRRPAPYPARLPLHPARPAAARPGRRPRSAHHRLRPGHGPRRRPSHPLPAGRRPGIAWPPGHSAPGGTVVPGTLAGRFHPLGHLRVTPRPGGRS